MENNICLISTSGFIVFAFDKMKVANPRQFGISFWNTKGLLYKDGNSRKPSL